MPDVSLHIHECKPINFSVMDYDIFSYCFKIKLPYNSSAVETNLPENVRLSTVILIPY